MPFHLFGSSFSQQYLLNSLLLMQPKASNSAILIMTLTEMKHPYPNFYPVTQKLLTPQKYHWLSVLTCSKVQHTSHHPAGKAIAQSYTEHVNKNNFLHQHCIFLKVDGIISQKDKSKPLIRPTIFKFISHAKKQEYVFSSC